LVIGGIKTEENNKDMIMILINRENYVSPSPQSSPTRGEEVNGTPERGGK